MAKRTSRKINDLSSQFYTQLRTEEQLGYVVFSSAMPIIQVPGLVFVVRRRNHTDGETVYALGCSLLDAHTR